MTLGTFFGDTTLAIAHEYRSRSEVAFEANGMAVSSPAMIYCDATRPDDMPIHNLWAADSGRRHRVRILPGAPLFAPEQAHHNPRI